MNPSPTPLRSPSIIATLAVGLERLLAALRPARQRGRIGRTQLTATPSEPGVVIGVIDDPELSIRLLSVRGRLTTRSMYVLDDAFHEVRNNAMLHVDLTDADFTDAASLTALADLLDRLEERGVRLRIVGLGRLSALRLD
jgi:ABC-type transporter Mla MlaB component